MPKNLIVGATGIGDSPLMRVLRRRRRGQQLPPGVGQLCGGFLGLTLTVTVAGVTTDTTDYPGIPVLEDGVYDIPFPALLPPVLGFPPGEPNPAIIDAAPFALCGWYGTDETGQIGFLVQQEDYFPLPQNYPPQFSVNIGPTSDTISSFVPGYFQGPSGSIGQAILNNYISSNGYPGYGGTVIVGVA